MSNTKRERFVWEEISKDPCVYKVSRTDSEDNSYVFLSGDEALIIDPRSEKMLESICRLAAGLGARPDKMQVYLTQAGSEEALALIENIPSEITLYCCREPENTIAPGAIEAVQEPEGPEPVLTRPASRSMRTWIHVQDGDAIRIGGKALQVINMEGCHREQTGLWIPKEGILFAGDAVSSIRLPEVRNWDPRIDMLALQFETIRRVRGLAVQCILTGSGPCTGVDELPEERAQRRDRITPECASVLDQMMEQYCMRILEVYQKVPAKGGISAETIIAKDALSKGAGTESCLRYLLYRKYIVRHDQPDEDIYERGSTRLTAFQEV